jgi:hypothetical protein
MHKKAGPSEYESEGPAQLKEGDVSSFPIRVRGGRQTPSPVYLGGDPHREGPRFPFDPPLRSK